MVRLVVIVEGMDVEAMDVESIVSYHQTEMVVIAGNPDVTFQNDNASSHTAHSVHDFPAGQKCHG